MKAISEKSFKAEHMRYGFARPDMRFLESIYALKADCTDYVPGQERFFFSESDRVLNLWTGSNIKPVQESWNTIRKHFEFIFSDEEIRIHWLNYWAWKLRYPSRKLKHVLLLTGAQGVGKSFFGRLLQHLLGYHNVGIAETAHLKSDFNSVLVNKEVVIFEELMAGQQLETSNYLKPFITEEKVMCNEKFMPRFEARTPLAFLAFSNFDKPIIVPEDDRRWHVAKTNVTKKGDEYYDALFEAIEIEGPAFLHYLLYEHDLKTFNPNEGAPMTDAKLELIERSLTPLRAALKGIFDEEDMPFHRDVVSAQAIQDALCSWPNISPKSREPRNIADALKQEKCVSLGQKMVTGTRHSLWIIRNPEKWSQASSDAIKEEFTR